MPAAPFAIPRRAGLRLGLAALGAAAVAPRGGRAGAPASRFPLLPASDGRTLIDQAGRPFFMLGDSPQGIYARPSAEDIAFYLATRRAQGFNTLLTDPTFTDNNSGHVLPGANGALPFLRNLHGGAYDGTSGTADLAAPNPAYWDYVDRVLACAEAHGFLVLQYVLAWGYGGKSWWLDLTNACNTEAVCHGFGAFLGRRFRARANLVWIDGSDFNGDAAPCAPDGTSGIARALAIARGMRVAGALQFRTGDWKADSLSTDQPAFAPLMTLNGIYAYGEDAAHATYVQARRAYAHTPVLPAYLKETGYEAERMIPGDAASVRKYAWWALLGGGTAGTVYGHGAIWPFAPGWREALAAPGGRGIARLGALMRGLTWQSLVPAELAGTRRLILSPNGDAVTRADHVAAAGTCDGTLLVAYVPPFGEGAQRIRLDLGGMRGALRAAWCDPSADMVRPVGRLAAGSTPELATPGGNAGGANDWVLVVRGGT